MAIIYLQDLRVITNLVCFSPFSSVSNLVVRQGKPEEVVVDLIKQLGSVSTVAFHEEVV